MSSSQEQQEADAKRQEFRRKLLQITLESTVLEKNLKAKSSTRRSQSAKKELSKAKIFKPILSPRTSPVASPQRSSRTLSVPGERSSKRRKGAAAAEDVQLMAAIVSKSKKPSLRSDMVEKAQDDFLFSVGNIATKIQVTTSNYRCLDPNDYHHINSSSPVEVFISKNSLMVDATYGMEAILASALNFIPPLSSEITYPF